MHETECDLVAMPEHINNSRSNSCHFGVTLYSEQRKKIGSVGANNPTTSQPNYKTLGSAEKIGSVGKREPQDIFCQG